MPQPISLRNQWPTLSDYGWYTSGGYVWPTPGDDGWPTSGDYVWPTPGDYRWPTPGGYAWPTPGDYRWPIIARSMTGGRGVGNPSTVRASRMHTV
jgi:hypothetical protein